MSSVIIEFRNLPEGVQWHEYQQLFSQFGTIKKLYLDREGAFGKVYFDKLEEATAAFEDINGKPPLNLVLLEPIIGDYAHKNRNISSPAMNQVGYHKYYDDDVEGHVSKFQYVDVFGRLVSTFEAEDGELYVSLNELKKSGFELYQAGTLPRPGQSRHFDEQLLYQFEMYMKMKATKFLAVHKLNISPDYANSIMDKEINQCLGKGRERSVKMDASSGLLKISASPDSPIRSRMSLDIDETRHYNSNRSSQKPRHSLSSVKGASTAHGKLSDQWNQRNDSFAPGDSNNRSSNRSGGLYQRYNSDDSINWSYSKYNQNQRGGSHLSKEGNNTLFNKRNNRNQNDFEEEEIRKPARRRPSNNFQTDRHSNFQQNRNVRNTFANDDDHNHNVAPYESNSINNEAKPLIGASLNRSALQKEQDGTYHVQVKEHSEESDPKPASKPKSNFTQTKDASTDLKENTESPAKKIEDKSNNVATPKQVTFAETIEKPSCSKTLQPVPNIEAIKSDNKSDFQTEIVNTPSSDTATSTTALRKSVVDISSAGAGFFECKDILSESTFVAFVFPNDFNTQLCELELITKECKLDPNFKADIGDFVAVLNDEDYVRGTVLNVVDGKYICALVDFGTVISTDAIRALPDKFKVIPEFTCLCKSDPKALEDIAANGDSNMFVTITAPGKLTLKIESANREHEIIATKWDPFKTSPLASTQNSNTTTEKCAESRVIVEKPVPEEVYKLRPPVQKLNDKDIVIIIAEQQNSLLVRTRECNLLLKHVNQELSSFKGEHFVKPPEIGQLAVASFNEDGLFRVVIRSVKNDNATVEYIDYGNSDVVPIKMLFNINKKLTEMDNTSIKINLKGFNGVAFSAKALKVLEECSTKKEKFTAVYNGKENEYDLLSSDQTSLSEKLKSLDISATVKLVPIPRPTTPKPLVVAPPPEPVAVEPPPEQGTTKLNDLPPSKIQIGINEVMCMYSGDMREGNVSFCLSNKETTNFLAEIQAKISDHVSSIPTESYHPEDDEVCLAKFSDEWYRACVVEKHEKDYNVYYIDFGNSHVVPASDIRKIPKELTTVEPLASLCILKGVLTGDANTIQDALFTEMQTDLQENEVYSINVVENIEGYLVITIPALYDKWKKQGLL